MTFALVDSRPHTAYGVESIGAYAGVDVIGADFQLNIHRAQDGGKAKRKEEKEGRRRKRREEEEVTVKKSFWGVEKGKASLFFNLLSLM